MENNTSHLKKIPVSCELMMLSVVRNQKWNGFFLLLLYQTERRVEISRA